MVNLILLWYGYEHLLQVLFSFKKTTIYTKYLISFLIAAICICKGGVAQLVLLENGIEYLVDFESSFQGVNDSAFIGNGMQTNPNPGELDSDAWMIKGLSDGDSQFSSNYLIGDYARGVSTGNVTTGGVYSFSTSESNVALGWQSTSTDMSPGSITLKVKNLSGFTIERIEISYRTWIINNQNRSQQFEFSYSIDNSIFITVPGSLIQSGLITDSSPQWNDSLFSFNLNLPEIENEEYFYLQWNIQDLSGSGSRDEWAIDDITLQITNNICLYEAFDIIESTSSLKSNEGFLLIGVDSYYDSPSNYGSHSPSARFDDNLDQIVTTSVANPFSLKFWMKTLGNNAGSSLVIDGYNGISWTQIANYTSLSGTGALYTVNNIASYSQFRFTYYKVNGNLAIDDVSISCGSCIPDSEPLPPSGQVNSISSNCNQSEISWTDQVAEYYLVLATEKASITNFPQDQYSYHSNNSFGLGEEIEDSVYVVYNGSSTLFTLFQLKSGTDYLINVIPYNGLACEENYSQSALSASFATPNCSDCPYLISALINPCSEDCNGQEGYNELLFFNSASFSFAADTSEFKIYYKGQSDNLLNQNMLSNPLLLTQLNNLTNCATLFIDATTISFIPDNSIIMLCNNGICLNDIDKSILCSIPVIYVLSCESDEWNPNGELLNSGYNPQQFILDFTNVSTSCLLNYSYVPNDIPQTDGSFVQFSSQGGTSTGHSVESNCNSTLTPLPLLWGSLDLNFTVNGVVVEWNTLSENDNLGFTIERSSNSQNFESIAWINSLGNSPTGFDYSYIDTQNAYGLLYYRIIQTDINGQSSISTIEEILINEGLQIFQQSNRLIIRGVIDDIIMINIYSINSSLLRTFSNRNYLKNASLNLNQLERGIYIIQLITERKIINKKIFWR